MPPISGRLHRGLLHYANGALRLSRDPSRAAGFTRVSRTAGRLAAVAPLLVVGLSLCVGVGCALRNRTSVSPVAVQLILSDQIWAQRGSDGFEPTTRLLREAHGVAPQDPGVWWRMVRLYVAEGLAATEERHRLEAFASARALGVGCLAVDGAFGARRARLGWGPALETVNPSHAPCLAWVGLAWAQWVAELGGDSAAVDLPAVRSIVATSARLGADRGLVAWADGLVLAAEGEASRVEAASRLVEAIDAAPDDIARRVDLVLYVAMPSGDQSLISEQVSAITQITPTTPEDRGALGRLQAAGLGAELTAGPEESG